MLKEIQCFIVCVIAIYININEEDLGFELFDLFFLSLIV